MMKTGGFAGFKNQIFSEWFINEDDPEIFNVTYGYGKKLEKLGGATHAENDLDKGVLEVKALVTKIGDLSKLTFKQKKSFLYDESNLIFHTFYRELNKKLQIYGLISTSAIGIKMTQLVRPSNSLKFRVMKNKIFDSINSEFRRHKRTW